VQELATRYPRYGYRRITALIRQKELVNQKRVQRVWRHHRLQVKRVRRPRPNRSRSARLEATHRGTFGRMILWKMRL
jgi:transposase InsO family protein